MRGLQKHAKEMRSKNKNMIAKALETTSELLSKQQLAFGACPTGTLDLAKKQKERVQLAPLCRQESKRNVSTGSLVLEIAIGFLGFPSRRFPVAIWFLGLFGYSPCLSPGRRDLVELWAILQSSRTRLCAPVQPSRAGARPPAHPPPPPPTPQNPAHPQ